MKRVACFYRVSSKKQLDNDEIIMQQKACRDFVELHKDWIIVREYKEKGISGYKKSSLERDELIRLKKDAENNKYDILLVYMFDRLGRKSDETPFIVKYFDSLDIEVWSTIEGRQKFDNEIDDFTNYMRFWQANVESQNISHRTDTKHKQMVENGVYRGGVPPYGYELIESTELNKKGKRLMKLSINDSEAQVVKLIFDLAYSLGYGGNRITKHLNEHGILSRSGKSWSTGVINYMIKNPIYCGKLSYGKRTTKLGYQHNQEIDKWTLSDKINELSIIQDDIWESVQLSRELRQPSRNKKQNIDRINVPTFGKLLFIGYIYCGHCGSSLSSTVNTKNWKVKDGTLKKKYRMKYRCTGKALNKTSCKGQTIYSSDLIEKEVLMRVYDMIDKIKGIDSIQIIEQYKERNQKTQLMDLELKSKQVEKNYRELSNLKSLVSVDHELITHYSHSNLNDIITKIEFDINTLNSQIRLLEDSINLNNVYTQGMKEFFSIINEWKNIYYNANIDKRKVMLSRIIDRIIVTRDEIKVEFKDYINEITK